MCLYILTKWNLIPDLIGCDGLDRCIWILKTPAPHFGSSMQRDRAGAHLWASFSPTVIVRLTQTASVCQQHNKHTDYCAAPTIQLEHRLLRPVSPTQLITLILMHLSPFSGLSSHLFLASFFFSKLLLIFVSFHLPPAWCSCQPVGL